MTATVQIFDLARLVTLKTETLTPGRNVELGASPGVDAHFTGYDCKSHRVNVSCVLQCLDIIVAASRMLFGVGGGWANIVYSWCHIKCYRDAHIYYVNDVSITQQTVGTSFTSEQGVQSCGNIGHPYTQNKAMWFYLLNISSSTRIHPD